MWVGFVIIPVLAPHTFLDFTMLISSQNQHQVKSEILTFLVSSQNQRQVKSEIRTFLQTSDEFLRSLVI